MNQMVITTVVGGDGKEWPETFDAQAWALAYCARNNGADEGLMTAWFANALMRGYDKAKAECERDLSFAKFREANVARCLKWHPGGLESWSPSDWMTAIVGELGELAGLIKMRNRERDGLPGNKFSPTDEMIGKEAADVLTYLDLFCAMHGIDLGKAAASKFNEVSERVGFPDRIKLEGGQ